jgi:hypothetical protein
MEEKSRGLSGQAWVTQFGWKRGRETGSKTAEKEDNIEMSMDAIILCFSCGSFTVDSVIIVLLVVSWRRITFARASTAADFTRVGCPWQFRATERSTILLLFLLFKWSLCPK